jgi:GH18 family chitinase
VIKRGSAPTDKMAFTKLCKMLREEFEKYAQKTGKERFLLTAAVAGAKNTIDKAYEVDKIAEYLDWFNLMTYDLHGIEKKIQKYNFLFLFIYISLKKT